MMYTPFSNLTNTELLAQVWNSIETPTPLEIELAQRLTAFVEEEDTCSELEAIVMRVGGVMNDA